MLWLRSTRRGSGEAGRRGECAGASCVALPGFPLSPLPRLGTQFDSGDRADPHDGFAHLVVGSRRARGNADSTRGTQPIIAPGLRLGSDGLVADHSSGYVNGLGVLDVVGGNAVLVDECRKVTRVARVVSAYHDHQIERLLQQSQYGILPFLSRRADRIERTEVLLQRIGSVAPGHALLHLFRNGERLPGQHRGLIGHSDAAEITLKIEPGRNTAGKVCPQGLDVAATFDEVADHPRFVHVEYHEIASLRVLHDLACRGLGLLVVVLSVDEGGVAVAGIALDPFPDVQHRSTGGVDQHTANAAKPLEVTNGDTEGGHDHHVVRGDFGEVEPALLFLGEEGNAHGPELLDDMGIVNDFPDQKEPAVGKLGPAFVGVLHGAIHTVAKPELPGQPESEMSRGKGVIVVLERLDHGTVVVRRQPPGDLALEAEPFAEVGLLHAVNVHCPGVPDRRPIPDPGPHSRKQQASSPGPEKSRSDESAEYLPPTERVPRTVRTGDPSWTVPESRFRCRPGIPAPSSLPASAPQPQRPAEATRPLAGQPPDSVLPPTLVQGRARALRRYRPEPYGSPEPGEPRTTQQWRLRTACPPPCPSRTAPDADQWRTGWPAAGRPAISKGRQAAKPGAWSSGSPRLGVLGCVVLGERKERVARKNQVV